MSNDFLRSIWVLAASFYIKNLCHHTSPYLVCQSLDHLSPTEGIKFFVWVNCIMCVTGAIFFLCSRSSVLPPQRAPALAGHVRIELINILFLRTIYKACTSVERDNYQGWSEVWDDEGDDN